jgi:hypothetical protein
VPFPVYACSSCGFQRVMHPIEAGCFPVTPEAPSVWFDDMLMWLSYQVRLNGAMALSKTPSLLDLHSANGCSTAPFSFKHLGAALVQAYSQSPRCAILTPVLLHHVEEW